MKKNVESKYIFLIIAMSILLYSISIILNVELYVTLFVITLLIFIMLYRYINLNRYIYILFPLLILSPSFKIVSSLPAIRLDDIWLTVVFLILFIKYKGKIKLKVKNKINVIFIFIILYIFFTIIISLVKEPELFSIPDFFEVIKIIKLYWIFLLITSIYPDQKIIKRLVEICIYSIVISAVFGIFQYYDFLNVNTWLSPLFIGDTNERGFYEYSRVVGTLGNPNTFAGALLIGVGLSFSSLFNKLNVSNILYFNIIVYSLLLTQSRTGLISGLIIISTIIVLNILTQKNLYKKIVQRLSIFLLIPVLVSIIILVAPSSLFRRLDGLSNIEEDNSFSMRLDVWQQVFEQRTKENLLFGTGPTGKLKIIFDNEWLQIITYYGVIGLVLFILLLFILLPRIYSIKEINISWIEISNFAIILGISTYMITAPVFQSVLLGPIIISILSTTKLIHNYRVYKQ